MRIVITHPGAETGARWVAALSARLPEAEVFASRDGDGPPADYAIGWMPPDRFFAEQTRLRAFFQRRGRRRSPARPPGPAARAAADPARRRRDGHADGALLPARSAAAAAA
ncbi:MAG: hypothetical protein M5U30_09030 [Burkholderiaceae bacterium]|nr:hypothetical protein [Burkholderiaceae bacterium]